MVHAGHFTCDNTKLIELTMVMRNFKNSVFDLLDLYWYLVDINAFVVKKKVKGKEGIILTYKYNEDPKKRV